MGIQSQSNINSTVCRKQKVSTKRKAAIPTRSELKSIGKKETDNEQKDFVSMNRAKTKQIGGKIKENEQERFVKKKDYGQVPEYIIKRKLEKEKAETLDILAENKHTVIEQIKHLPLVIETPSMIKHQSSLNKKLKEIEKNIAIFQKPTVFV